ncbi:MAG: hypothetical protein HY875_00235 [Chloroflexi bacterium]|nr:hypothetical protein [Chloroflexota bacterium]
MTTRNEVAAALAYFEESDDIALLHQLVEEIAPRAKRAVGKLLQQGGEDAIPPPAELRAAKVPAPRDKAVAAVRATDDFALLQVLARAIGRRIEAIEIVASAEFPEGVRVSVPARPVFPPPPQRLTGIVEATGTSLQVLLDNGETWEGPPSLARRVVER